MSHTPTKTNPIWDGTQKYYKFENGRGASVVRHAYSYGGDMGLWELAVLDGNGDLDYSTPITGDILGHLTDEDVEKVLDRIAAL